jgi:hypothetical protein
MMLTTKGNETGLGLKRTHRVGAIVLLLCAGLSIVWGAMLARTTPYGMLDYKCLYYGTRCLLKHCDPYSIDQLKTFYLAGGGEPPSDPIRQRKLDVVTIYVNSPATFLFVAPFTLLGLGMGQTLWMAIIMGGITLGAALMWKVGVDFSPGVSLFLVCLLILNCEVVFAGGNTGGLVAALCVVGVWCLLEERFVPAGILCLAIGLAIKPHSAGLIWLYFLLAGGVLRKRALQTLAFVCVFGLASLLWISRIAPHWMPEMSSNIALLSGQDGNNAVGPGSFGMSHADLVIDLQSALSVFWNDQRIYNPASYMVCGVLILIWAIATVRMRWSAERGWIALAVIVPLTLLATYHRPHDAKLLLLTFPASAILWAEGVWTGKLALMLNTAAVLLTSDIPLAILVQLTRNLPSTATDFWGKMMAVMFARPAPLVLLVMSIFYLWIYLRRPSATLEPA